MAKFEKKNVRPIKVVAKCSCGGELELAHSGYALTSNPVQLQHMCNKCGSTEWFNEIYPNIEYEEIDTLKESAVGHGKAVHLLEKHIALCEHLLSLIAKEREVNEK